MYIIKNAWKNITRSKGRNILVGAIVVLIAVASCVALAIQNAAAEIVSQQKQASEIVATLNVDRQKMMRQAQEGQADIRELMQNMPVLSLEEVKLFGTSVYVKNYTYTVSGTINGASIIPYSTGNTDSGTASDNVSGQETDGNAGQRPAGGFGGDAGGRNPGVNGDFTITGYSGSFAMEAFRNGTNQIVEGSMFEDGTEEFVCVISDELLLLNGLSIGDTITLCNPANTEETYDFVIKGSYQSADTGSLENQFRFSTAMDPANTILVSYEACQKMLDASKAANTAVDETVEDSGSSPLTGQLSAAFYLTSAEEVDAFTADLKEKGLNEYYSVSTNAETVAQSLEAIQDLNRFSSIFLLVVIVAGGVILVVINLINIRERKYEVGVLTAIGMKKGKVAVQFVIELLLVTLTALILGSGIGAILSVPTADLMLENQLAAQKSHQEQVQNNFGGMQMGEGQPGGGRQRPGGMGDFAGVRQNSTVSYIDQIHAAINAKVLFQLFGIGLLLTLLSGCVAVVFIARYSPLKILSERG